MSHAHTGQDKRSNHHRLREPGVTEEVVELSMSQDLVQLQETYAQPSLSPSGACGASQAKAGIAVLSVLFKIED